MSGYSQTMGSFVRNGDYPLEANYIFGSEQELKDFYQDELYKTHLHKGLLKIVSLKDKQILYWVIERDGELVLEPLIESDSLDNLLDVIDRLYDLENTLKILVGAEDIIPTLATLPYQNFVDLANALQEVVERQKEHRDLQDQILDLKQILRNLQIELNDTQRGVGLDQSGLFSPDKETYYLKDATSVMNALRTLDRILHKQAALLTEDTNTVDLELVEDDTNNTRTITANVKLASESDIQATDEGLYHKVDMTFNNGEVTLLVNGEERTSFNIGLDAIIDDSTHYDSTTETIVLVFKLHNGQTQEFLIPVADLITEWNTNNTNSITLNKTRVVDGTDTLTADVKVSGDSKNGIEVKNNGIFMSKDAADLTYSSELSIKDKIDAIDQSKLTKEQADEYYQLIGDYTDIIEVGSYDLLPSDGKIGKIYITTDDNKTYRWSGSTWVEISNPLDVTDRNTLNNIKELGVVLGKVTGPDTLYTISRNQNTLKLGFQLSTSDKGRDHRYGPEFPLATTDWAGLMSLEDKFKLDSIDVDTINDIKERVDSIEEDLYEDPFNGYEYVDMGEAGIWAKYPIGVTEWNSEALDNIKYFAWGEIEGYIKNQVGVNKNFSWSDYKWCEGSNITLTKYCYDSSYGYNGFTDTLNQLELEDDAAHVYMGGNWRIPTNNEFPRLQSLCNTEWVTNYNGITGLNGKLFKLKTDESKQLFLPAFGYCQNGSVNQNGTVIALWLSSLSTYNTFNGSNYVANSNMQWPPGNQSRNNGYCIIGFLSPGSRTSAKFYTKSEVDEKLSDIDIPEIDLSDIESKLEGVTKAADDSEVFKTIRHISTGKELTWVPRGGKLDIYTGEGIEIDSVGPSFPLNLMNIKADTNYLATRDYVGESLEEAAIFKHPEDNNTAIQAPETTASGDYSMSVGFNTTALGQNTFTSGHSSTAYGTTSSAQGKSVEAINEAETAIGSFNVSRFEQIDDDDDELITNTIAEFIGSEDRTLFTIGNGNVITDPSTSNTTTTFRHNAFEIRQNGDIYVSDTHASGQYYEKPMLNLQEKLKSHDDLIEQYNTLKQEFEQYKEDTTAILNSIYEKLKYNG